MAKEDFCFTYYDGDAARDKAHMTRLCRGAYDDLISMQRKVGHMDLPTIQMVLSSDFETCWKSLSFILKIDELGKYFIEWVEKSIAEMKKNAARQKKRIDDYWDGVKDGKIPRNKKSNTAVQKNNKVDIPYNEDVNEDEDVNVFEDEDFEKSEKLLLVPQMLKTFKKFNSSYQTQIDKDYEPLQRVAQFITSAEKIPYNPRDHDCVEKIISAWGVISEFISKDNFFKTYNLMLIEKHIQSISQKILHGTSKNGSTKKITSSDLDTVFAKRYSQRQ